MAKGEERKRERERERVCFTKECPLRFIAVALAILLAKHAASRKKLASRLISEYRFRQSADPREHELRADGRSRVGCQRAHTTVFCLVSPNTTACERGRTHTSQSGEPTRRLRLRLRRVSVLSTGPPAAI